jgi:hypothetical protein
MKKRFFFVASLSAIVLTLLFFIGCGGGGGGSSSGTSPTNTSTTSSHSNEYKVLYGTKGTKATGLIIVLPAEVDTPSGYSAAGGASVSYKNSSGVVVTSTIGSNGVFNAKDMGIPVINDSSDAENVTTVDVTYNDTEETNIPIPVFDEDTADDGNLLYIKIIPGAGLVKVNGEQAFYCIGITDQGYISNVKNVNWAVSDESTISIKSITDDGSICTVQGIKGGAFPEIAYANLTATVDGTVTPTATVTSEPTSTVTETATATPEESRDTLTDTASVGVIAIPEQDANISGTLLDQNGSPIANARLIFRSAETEAPDNAFTFYMAYSADTDESGNYSATVTSGQSYSVVALVNEEIIIPTASTEWVPSKLSFTYMNAYNTTPETFGPTVAGDTVVDFTLGDAIGVNPWPNPTPTATATSTSSPDPTPTVTTTYSPIPWPTYTPIPYPSYTPDPYPTGLWNSKK